MSSFRSQQIQDLRTFRCLEKDQQRAKEEVDSAKAALKACEDGASYNMLREELAMKESHLSAFTDQLMSAVREILPLPYVPVTSLNDILAVAVLREKYSYRGGVTVPDESYADIFCQKARDLGVPVDPIPYERESGGEV